MAIPRLRILIIAHEMSPIQGSECATGWNISTRLAAYHDVTVIYATGSQAKPESYRDALEEYERKHGKVPGVEFIAVDQPEKTLKLAKRNQKFSRLGPTGLPVLYFLGYRYWEMEAYKVAEKLHRQKPFDAVHHLTQLAFREPGYCWKLGIPFFWGPTGGVGPLPSSFYKILSFKAAFIERLRGYSNAKIFRSTERIIEANKSAAVIYVYSLEDQALFQKRAKGKVSLMLDVGTQIHDGLTRSNSEDHKIIKGIWCGHIIERKAPELLLRALAKSEDTKTKIRFTILGDGPLAEPMKALAKELGLTNIDWVSNVNRETVFKMMAASDFFVHTSLREATSNVIPEALSTGLPVICHDANGMSLAINPACGIKIPLVDPQTSINGFHEAMQKLINDRSLLKKMQQGALKRSEEISWDNMARTMAGDYAEAAGKKYT